MGLRDLMRRMGGRAPREAPADPSWPCVYYNTGDTRVMDMGWWCRTENNWEHTGPYPTRREAEKALKSGGRG